MSDMQDAKAAMITTEDAVLEIRDLKKHFPIEKGFLRKVIGHVRAVDGVSFDVPRGRTVGVVGESGCGKTTLGRCILRAIEPTSGEILFRRSDESEVEVMHLGREELRLMRREMQMVYQDPYSSLDPRMTVYDIISEPAFYSGVARGADLDERVKYVAEVVGLNISHLKRYPHAFSGGQRQRIGIARALVVDPTVVVADEPVSALDVSIQAQILNLLLDLQEEFDLTYLFISHDLSVIEHISQQVVIMYVGKVMEFAPTRELFANPLHPYTEALLSAVPKPDPKRRMKRIILAGEVPNPAKPPEGCYFHPRCRYAKQVCSEEEPELREVAAGRTVACHFAESLSLRGIGSM